MPFNDGTKRIAALYAFVDQFIAGDSAMRSSFDQVFGDMVNSVNELAAYLEASAAAGADQRYMGRLVAVPTTRLDAAPLEEGDFYVAAHADAGRVGLVYVYNGSTFVVSSDFTTIGSWFRDTLSAAASQAAGRVALGLGTAATQNTTAFAAASVETDVALALKLMASGIAKSMTSNDWNNAHLAGPGTTMVQANAAATNAPVALNAAGLYVAYDANNGFLIAAAHGSATIYYRMRVGDAWGSWHRLPQRDTVISSLSINATLSDTPGADLIRIGPSVTDLPSGAAEGDVLLSSVYDANSARQLILTSGRKLLSRSRIAGVTGPWEDLAPQEKLLAKKTASASASLIFTEVDHAKYRNYEFVLRDVLPGTDSRDLQLEVSNDGGATWSPATYIQYLQGGAAGGAGLAIVDNVIAPVWTLTVHNVSNAVNAHGVNGNITIYGAGAAKRTRHRTSITYDTPGSGWVFGSGSTNDQVIHNAFRWTFSSGSTIASGEIEMWGIF